jgi:hypothetical protein
MAIGNDSARFCLQVHDTELRGDYDKNQEFVLVMTHH